MAFDYLRSIPTPDEIIQSIPVDNSLRQLKRQRDAEIRAALESPEGRFLVIVGPCSAHDEDSVCEYVSRLAKVQEQTREKLVLVPRIYTNKPRTVGSGYKGMLHQPDHLKSPNISEGIRALRAMHIRSLRQSGLTAADEMLYPGNHPYLNDLLSYVAVGARSVENQQHRLTASGLDVPVGMKNPTSGDCRVMLNSIQAAQMPHVFTYNGWEVRTTGNASAHAILRGAVNQHGRNIPNYHYEDLMRIGELYLERGLVNPAIVVDVNHANSNKQFDEQPRVAMEVLESCRHAEMIQKLVRGIMVESFLVSGKQGPEGTVYGQSITDPCLGWDETEDLLLRIADSL